MAYTQEQLQAMEEAFAAGTTRVQHEDRSVTFRSLEELKEIIQTIKHSVNPSASRPARTYAKFRKG